MDWWSTACQEIDTVSELVDSIKAIMVIFKFFYLFKFLHLLPIIKLSLLFVLSSQLILGLFISLCFEDPFLYPYLTWIHIPSKLLLFWSYLLSACKKNIFIFIYLFILWRGTSPRQGPLDPPQGSKPWIYDSTH